MTKTSNRSRRSKLWISGFATVFTVGALFGYGASRNPMEIHEQRIISGNIEDVWHIATDVNHWSHWDPHEEAGEIYGPFEVGTKAYSKPRGGPGAHWSITHVTQFKSWSLTNPMKIGTLNVENRYVPLPDGKIRCEKTMQVSGWILVALFKLHFETETRKDMHATWLALEKRIQTIS